MTNNQLFSDSSLLFSKVASFRWQEESSNRLLFFVTGIALPIGESGKDFNSSSLITWPTIWNGLTGLFLTRGGGSRDRIGCSGSTLCFAIALLASTGGMICHLWLFPPMNNSAAEFELLRSSPLFSNAEVLNDLGDSTRIWKIGDGVICKNSVMDFIISNH